MDIKEIFSKVMEEIANSISEKEIQDITNKLNALGNIYPASLDEIRYVLEREKENGNI